ncbi:hypothetical protein C8R44DRAFT_976261 [Mycena epipterygia]|nr:hypothetical protein C8R44DRAFT_976261 [Mycena epipterygia]
MRAAALAFIAASAVLTATAAPLVNIHASRSLTSKWTADNAIQGTHGSVVQFRRIGDLPAHGAAVPDGVVQPTHPGWKGRAQATAPGWKRATPSLVLEHEHPVPAEATHTADAPGWKREGEARRPDAPGWRRDAPHTADAPGWRRDAPHGDAPGWKRDGEAPTQSGAEPMEATHTADAPGWKKRTASPSRPSAYASD